MKYKNSGWKTMAGCLLFCVFISCTAKKTGTAQSRDDVAIAKELRQLEYYWLEREFALDTASIAQILDEGFISLSGSGLSDKQAELKGIYKSISDMYRDSIFIDSFQIEEPFITRITDSTAVTILVCHSYKKNRGVPAEKRTRFYDVWVRRPSGWKALSSQATVLEEK